jgi:hypothetical protein
MLIFERNAEAAAGGVQHAQALGHHLRPDAVAGNHGDSIFTSHDRLPPKSELNGT